MPDRMKSSGGSSLMLCLFIILLLSIIGFAILFVTDVDLKTSKNYSYSSMAAAVSESGIQEAIYRLNLRDFSALVPYGSLVTVNELVNYDARISADPSGVLEDGIDNDGDGSIDDPDELNLVKDWEVRILLTRNIPAPGAPYELLDTSIPIGPPWGSKFVLPTIQPSTSWLPYTSRTIDGKELLIRYEKESDLGIGDPEGDGDEIIFYDPQLARNGVEDRNTLSALGGNGNPADDSPYNITWSDGTTVYRASGSPVVRVQCVGRVMSSGSILGLLDLAPILSERKVTVETYQRVGQVAGKALCGCSYLDVSFSSRIDSYRSSQGDYGAGPVYNNGDVGSNDTSVIGGSSQIYGDVQTGDDLTINGSAYLVNGYADVGGTITGSKTHILGEVSENAQPKPRPCFCDFDIDHIVKPHVLPPCTGDGCQNVQGIVPGLHPYKYGTTTIKSSVWIYQSNYNLKLSSDSTIILTGGKYYFDSIDTSGNANIQIGRDTNGDGVVDAPPTSRVEIYVSGDITLAGKGIINSSRPTDLVIYCNADCPVYVVTGDDDVTVAGHSEFRGVILAPKTMVKLTGNDEFKGAVLAYSVYANGSAGIHYDEDLSTLLPVRGFSIPVGWSDSD